MANIEVVNKGQEIDEDILSVIQKLSGDQEALRRAYSLSVDRNIAKTSVRARGEEIKVAGATPSTSTKKKPRARDLIAKIEKAKTLEDLGALVPDDEKRITVLRARDDKRNQLKSEKEPKAEKKKTTVTPETEVVVVTTPQEKEVHLSKPGEEQEVKRIASEPVVDKEELSQSAFEYTPSREADKEEQRKINRKITRTVKPENVSITTDDSTVEAIKSAVGDTEIGDKKIKDLISAYLEASESDRQDRNKTKNMITKFLGSVDIGPVRKILQSLDIKPKEENPVSGLAAMLASMQAGLAALDEPTTSSPEEGEEVPALEPALRETKTVQDYINESYEDKFNKLMKAFIK